CHDPAQPKLTQAHRRFPLGAIDCASCHNPHGSAQPKLIRSKPHAVFATCGKCHDTNGAKPQALLAKTSTDLCVRCHGAVKTEAQKPGAHKALDKGCVTCHTPHAADERGLIKADERTICLSCHEDVKKSLAAAFSIHPLKADGGRCSACHAPHRSDVKPLLKAQRENLCQTCHKDHSQFSHPFGPGVTDPRTGGTMTCLSCHTPHASQQPYLLPA